MHSLIFLFNVLSKFHYSVELPIVSFYFSTRSVPRSFPSWSGSPLLVKKPPCLSGFSILLHIYIMVLGLCIFGILLFNIGLCPSIILMVLLFIIRPVAILFNIWQLTIQSWLKFKYNIYMVCYHLHNTIGN